FRVRVPNQVLSDAIHVFGHHWIGHQLGALLHLLGVLLAHGNFLLDGVPVSQSFAAQIAVADGVHIVDAPLLHLVIGWNGLIFRFIFGIAFGLSDDVESHGTGKN